MKLDTVRHRLELVHAICEILRDEFAMKADLFKRALDAQKHDDEPSAPLLEWETQIFRTYRASRGLGDSSEAARTELFRLIEEAADIFRKEPLKRPVSEEVLALRRKILEESNVMFFTMRRFAILFPDYALRLPEEPFRKAVNACINARPGRPPAVGKKRPSKWVVFSNLWFELSGERVTPLTLKNAPNRPDKAGKKR
jgi:hypothetical protein